MNKYSISIAVFAGALALTACKKDKEEETQLQSVTLTGDQNSVLVLEDRINSATIPDYVISESLLIHAGMEIRPGTTIRMKAGASIVIDGSGYIKAEGNAGAMIEIAGETPVAGAWGYILVQTNNVNNKLDYVTIRDGGGDAGWNGMIYCYGDGRLSVKNSNLHNSASNGLFVYDSYFNLTEVSNVTVSGVAQDAFRINANDMGAFSSINASGNRINVAGGEVNIPTTWKNAQTPYYFSETPEVTAAVTVEPGTQFLFGPNVSLRVLNQGSFKAIGTPGNEIRFMGLQNVEGSWGAIQFVNTNSVNNEMQYCEVAYGGSDPGWNAMLYLYSNARLRLGNSTVHGSYSWGVINESGLNTFIDDGNNTFYGNLQGDIGN